MKKHTKYTEINTVTWAQCDKTQFRPESCKNCSSMCAQPQHTVQYRTVLIT